MPWSSPSTACDIANASRIDIGDLHHPGEHLGQTGIAIGAGQCAITLLGQFVGLQTNHHQCTQHQREYSRRGRNRDPVAAHELAQTVATGTDPGTHRTMFTMAPDILDEMGHAGIALVGLPGHGGQHDAVEVTANAAHDDCGRLGETALPVGRLIGGLPPSLAGSDGIGLADGPNQFRGAGPGQAERHDAREQTVEQQAQLVDLGSDRHRRARNLLGAGILRRQPATGGLGQRRFLRRVEILLHPGQPEIQQLDLTIAGYQHVGRLDVPMQDQLSVGILQRRADLFEKVQTLADVETVLAGKTVDRQTFDVLHCKPGPPVVGHAAVDESCDARVFKPGKHIALALELAVIVRPRARRGRSNRPRPGWLPRHQPSPDQPAADAPVPACVNWHAATAVRPVRRWPAPPRSPPPSAGKANDQEPAVPPAFASWCQLPSYPGISILNLAVQTIGAMNNAQTITRMLHECRASDDPTRTFDALIPLDYDDLKQVARAQLRRLRPGHSHDTTGLVNDSYAKLKSSASLDWTDRQHFFAIAARACARSWSTMRAA